MNIQPTDSNHNTYQPINASFEELVGAVDEVEEEIRNDISPTADTAEQPLLNSPETSWRR